MSCFSLFVQYYYLFTIREHLIKLNKMKDKLIYTAIN